MVRHKWIEGVCRQIWSYIIECDSCAAIDGARMTPREREELKKKLREVSDYISNKLK